MSAASLIKYLHLAYFAKPNSDRVVYREIRRIRARHIVGIGLGDGEMARKMILCAAQLRARDQVKFTGIDLFELRSGSGGELPLKQAHRKLGALGAQVRLVPGDPLTALSRAANSLLETDLVVIRADQDSDAMAAAWFYLPRMLHERSLVLVEKPPADGRALAGYQILDRNAVQHLADKQIPRRRAA